MLSKVTILLLLILTVITLVYGQQCEPDHTHLNSLVNTSTGGGSYVLTGYATVCVNGSFVPVCNVTTLTALEAIPLCLRHGLIGGGYYGTYPSVNLPSLVNNSTVVVTSFRCSSFGTNCTTTTTSSGVCPNGYAIVNCKANVCDDDTYNFHLFNNYTSLIDGTTVITGVPQTCVNGNYVRYCNSPLAPFSPSYGLSLCALFGYSYGRMLPSNASLYTGSPNGIGYLQCIGSNCGSVSLSTTHQCYSGAYDLVVQCYHPRPCQGSGFSFYNSVTTYANGRELVTGIVLNCLFGYTAALCDVQPVSPSIIHFACTLLGFEGGTVLPANPSIYGSAPLGSIYFTNYTCPSNATSPSNCTAIAVQTQLECYNGQHDVIVQCYRSTGTTIASSTTPTISPSSTATSITASSTTSTTSSSSSSGSVTPTDSISSSNIRLIAGVAVGVMVLILMIIIGVIVILLFVYLYKSGSKNRPFKKRGPVELYKYSDVRKS